jgi:hypothetical protein
VTVKLAEGVITLLSPILRGIDFALDWEQVTIQHFKITHFLIIKQSVSKMLARKCWN